MSWCFNPEVSVSIVKNDMLRKTGAAYLLKHLCSFQVSTRYHLNFMYVHILFMLMCIYIQYVCVYTVYVCTYVCVYIHIHSTTDIFVSPTRAQCLLPLCPPKHARPCFSSSFISACMVKPAFKRPETSLFKCL